MNIVLSSVSKQYQTANRQNVSFKANEQQVVDLMRQMKEGKLAIHSHNIQSIEVLAQGFEPKKHSDLFKEAKKLVDDAIGGAKDALQIVYDAIPKV